MTSRQKFLPWLIRMYDAQTYPAMRRKLIILADDHELPVSARSDITYACTATRLALGAKRNLLNRMALDAGADIIVHMDDDDVYPPERIGHCVDVLSRQRGQGQICGSSVMHVLFADTGEVRRYGPYMVTASSCDGEETNHATAGTWAYTRSYAETHAYDEAAPWAEEASFTRGFSEPMAQLDPLRTILCVAHAENTVPKSAHREEGFPTSLRLSDFVGADMAAQLADFHSGR